MKNISQDIDIFAKKLSGELSQDELSSFESWLQESPENLEEFSSFEKIWNGVDVVQNKRPFDKNKAWDRFSSEVSNVKSKKFNLAPVYSAAAIIVIGLFSWMFFEIFAPSHPEVLHFATVNSETNSILLTDSSRVTLNENSSIEYLDNYINTKKRIVKLKGEAFFEVTPNPERPFVVHVNNKRVEVRGTSFYVEQDSINDVVTVLVKTGKVAIYTEGGIDTIFLTKGQQGVINNLTPSLVVNENKSENFVGWRTKKFNFVKEPLHKIIATINESYYSHVSIPDSTLALEEFDVDFEGKTYEEVVSILETTADISFKNENGRDIIVRDKN